MLIEKKHRNFANGSVYCFALEDGKLIEFLACQVVLFVANSVQQAI